MQSKGINRYFNYLQHFLESYYTNKNHETAFFVIIYYLPMYIELYSNHRFSDKKSPFSPSIAYIEFGLRGWGAKSA